MNRALDINDFDAQAHEMWRLGEQLCGDCKSYHQLRGVLMNTSGIRGGRYDAETLGPLMEQLAAPGSRILIAGSADAGLLRTVLDCATARPLSITIVDLCPTPLALIDSLQLLPDVSISTQVRDLTQPLNLGQFDLIFSHSMLPFVPPSARSLVLDSLRTALAPGGRLIVSVIVGPELSEEERVEARRNWFEKALKDVSNDADMDALAGEAKEELLQDYANRFRYMKDSISCAEDIAALLKAQGFQIDAQRFGRDVQSVSASTKGRRSAVFVAYV